eukprot:Nk52_evm4s2640 gene=Nk52_evmTU4s2640
MNSSDFGGAETCTGNGQDQHHGDDRTNHVGHCSWCFQECEQVYERINHRLRRIYHCKHCANHTVTCSKKCGAYAREYQELTGDDKCFKCSGRIQSWENADVTSTDLTDLYCSWCFEKCSHRILSTKTLLYECRKCEALTKQCKKKCGEAMCRALVHSSCLKCMGYINSWESSSGKESLDRHSWCSCCLEKSVHSLVTKNLIRRDEYVCTSCSNSTMPCFKCKDNMTKKGPKHLKCVTCKLSEKDREMKFEMLLERKHKVYEMANEKSFIVSELERESEYKEKARNANVIRPFLLLVSMHPAARNSVGIRLGMQLLSAKAFGDSHAEAWKILNKNKTGLIAKCKGKVETFTAQGCSWFDMLKATNDVTFKNPEFSDSEAKSQKNQDKSNEYGNRFEILLLDSLSKKQQGKMTPADIRMIDEICATPEIQALFEDLEQSGLKGNESLKRWMVAFTYVSLFKSNELNKIDERFRDDISLPRGEQDVVNEMGALALADDKEDIGPIVNFADLEDEARKERVASVATDVIRKMNRRVVKGEGYFKKYKASKRVGKRLATFAVVRFAITPVFPPLALGVIAYSVAGIVFGSDHEGMFPVVAHILVQRLLLASQRITIDDYY